jgi:hypothetical protein
MEAVDNLAHVTVFDALPAVVVAKLSIIIVKVFVKLPTAVVNILFLY